MNCWEYMSCGRIPGGKSADELGVCPAYIYGAGHACWLVAGTFCGGQVQGTFAQKEDSCGDCDFFKRFDLQNLSHMRSQFGQMVLMAAILDTVGALVVVLDPDGRVIRFNRCCERTTGYSFDQVRGRHFWDLFLVPEEIEVIKNDFEGLRRAKFPKQHEYYLVTRDGDHRLIRWSNTVLQDDDGIITQVIATGLDITEYKKAVEKNRQLASIVEFSEDSIASSTLEGVITSWNRGAEQIYGYTAEEIIGRPASVLIPSDRADELTEILKRMQSGERIEHFETEHLNKQGRRIALSLTFSPILNAKDELTGCSIIGRDVTKQRQAELNYAAIFNAANDAIFVHDIQTGAIVDANRRMTEMYGYTIEEARRLDVETMSAGTPPYTQNDAVYWLRKALDGEPQLFEWLAKDKAGRLFWVEVNIKRFTIGSSERLLAVIRDISERKRAEDELRRADEARGESDLQVRLLMNSTAEGIWGTDTNGIITFANAAAARLLGFDDPSKLVGRNGHYLCHHSREDGTPYPVEECRKFQAVRRGESIRLEDEVFWRADGTSLPVEYWGYPVRRDGQIVGSVVAFVDITERKRTEEELRRSQAELRALAAQLISAREEESKRLARDLHDAFGQKLAVLNLHVSELESLISSCCAPALEKLRPLREEIGNLAQQIHQLSRQLHPAVLRELGLAIAVESECAMYSQQEGIPVCFSPEGVPEQIPGDIPLCLYRVLQESLQNIRKHARAKGVEVKLVGAKDEILLVVEDSGIGFDPQEVRRNGGLGLVSMEERVRSVGGNLSISSKPGHGTRIEVRCPLEGN